MKPSLRLLLAPLLFSAPLLFAQEAEKAPAPPRPQDDAPVWTRSFDEAVERARKMRDGRILVELRNASCPECERMAKAYGPRFVPTEGLRRMAGRGELYFPVTTN